MFDAAAQLASLYDAVGDTVTPAVGEPFKGQLQFGDSGELMIAARVTLRYPAASAPALQEGDVITVGGMQFKLAEDPAAKFDQHEFIVPLNRVPA